jgi:Ca2+-binding EF-hand superfamily protein
MRMSPTHPSSVPPELIEELREDFEEVDDDQDGQIDFAEFRGLLENLEAGMSDAELRIGFREIDADHDGRISLREFVAWRSGR